MRTSRPTGPHLDELQRRYEAMTAEFCRSRPDRLDKHKLRSADYPWTTTRKRLLAIEVLLEEPEEINDILETELHALRDRLHAIALS